MSKSATPPTQQCSPLANILSQSHQELKSKHNQHISFMKLRLKLMEAEIWDQNVISTKKLVVSITNNNGITYKTGIMQCQERAIEQENNTLYINMKKTEQINFNYALQACSTYSSSVVSSNISSLQSQQTTPQLKNKITRDIIISLYEIGVDNQQKKLKIPFAVLGTKKLLKARINKKKYYSFPLIESESSGRPIGSIKVKATLNIEEKSNYRCVQHQTTEDQDKFEYLNILWKPIASEAIQIKPECFRVPVGQNNSFDNAQQTNQLLDKFEELNRKYQGENRHQKKSVWDDEEQKVQNEYMYETIKQQDGEDDT